MSVRSSRRVRLTPLQKALIKPRTFAPLPVNLHVDYMELRDAGVPRRRAERLVKTGRRS